jgi:phage shock protein C
MRKLYRSRNEKKIAGICGGISRLYDLDPNLVRLCAVLLCLLTGVIPLIITYMVGWAIVPYAEEPAEDNPNP